jgi:superfamily I DNA/RNA helicase
MVLMNNTRAQMGHLQAAFDALGVPYSVPRALAPADTLGGRLLYALMRIVHDGDDYAAHRDLLELQHGVGIQTCLEIENTAVGANLNFRGLFYSSLPTGTFTARCETAIQRVASICAHIQTWQPMDTVVTHDNAFQQLIGHVFSSSASAQQAAADWQAIRSQFPDDSTLEEILAYLKADTDTEQANVLQAIHLRLRLTASAPTTAGDQVRILTMHGAKGLEAKVVLIPGVEQEIVPGRRALQSPGLLQEARRLLYVSITRAKAACLMSLSSRRTGASAQALRQQFWFNSPPSQFATETGVTVVNRTGGLTPPEAQAIVADCANLQP